MEKNFREDQDPQKAPESAKKKKKMEEEEEQTLYSPYLYSSYLLIFFLVWSIGYKNKVS